MIYSKSILPSLHKKPHILKRSIAMQTPFTIIIPLLSKCTLEKEEEKDYVQSLKANENAREKAQ
jgi:hypothetical protein